MKNIRYKVFALLLVPIVMLLNLWYKVMPSSWEQVYSMNINKVTIQILSKIFGIFPFSVFEILIYATVLGAIAYIIYVIVLIIKEYQQASKRFNASPVKSSFKVFVNALLNILVFLSLLYVSFMLLWGLNYRRPQFGSNEGIVEGSYTTEQLGDLYAYLLKEAGEVRENLPEDENGVVTNFGDYRDVFNRAQLGYDVASEIFIELDGSYGRPKPILASELLNYTGITGIYSPFTGEPNVNVAIPDMNIPATVCHEMAHQRGYGFEDQCNFIAYLTCIMHPDDDFKYSGYILGISYVSNALAKVDYDRLVELNDDMPEKVYQDLTYHNEFWKQYEGKAREQADNVNSAYLKANGVLEGTESYGKVVDLMLAYYDMFFVED